MNIPDHVESVDWRTSLRATAFRYHVLIAWVAVVLNPIWAIGDYYNSPFHFMDFLVFRLVISVATAAVLLMKDRFKHRPEIIALVPFIGISIQNAYMYSVMNIDELRKHTFAYIALFIGAGMFVLWKPLYSYVVVGISFVANIVCFAIFGHLQITDVLINGGMLTASVALFTILLIHTRTTLTRREIIARLKLAESNKALAETNSIIEEKNKDISDSINYARSIQQAMLPRAEKYETALGEHFIMYLPKDVISGDFYWFTELTTTPKDSPPERVLILAAVDCTGHGVPGALMSIVGGTILNQAAVNTNVNTPAQALEFLNRELIRNLTGISDGMDMSLIALNRTTRSLQYAGANNAVYIVRDGNLIELRPDKQSIGADTEDAYGKKFTNNTYQLEKGDMVYLFTDGFADQFGGPLGKKYKYKPFQQYLCGISSQHASRQRDLLLEEHQQWKGQLQQVDDILVIGIRA